MLKSEIDTGLVPYLSVNKSDVWLFLIIHKFQEKMHYYIMNSNRTEGLYVCGIS